MCKILLYYYNMRLHAWQGLLEQSWISKIFREETNKQIVFLRKEDISLARNALFIILLNNYVYIYYNLCLQEKNFNAYLCSYIHRQNSQYHMYTSRIPQYCYKSRLNDRCCLSIHRYLICTKTKQKKCV